MFGFLLLVPAVAMYAAGALGVGMLGAMYTELFRGVPAQAVAPLVLFAMLIWLLWLRATYAAQPWPVRRAAP